MKHFLLFGILIAQFAVNAQTDKRLATLKSDLTKLVDTYKTSGFAVAIIEKDKVIFTEGFGYADIAGKRKVDANTLFPIGSSSKSFTCALLGNLRDEGKLTFQDNPRKYVPELSFHEKVDAEHLQIKDLMTHRTGLPRHDLAWYLFPSASKDSLIKRIAFQEPSAELREVWQYNNFMFLVQGVISERITKKSWEEQLKERYFRPLGMKTTNSSLAELNAVENRAFGYRKGKNGLEMIPYFPISGMAPAGSINSNVTEMSNWVRVWLNGGKIGETQILPTAYVQEAMSPQMIVKSTIPDKERPNIHQSTYGYGWFNTSYKGHYRVEHGGAIDGFIASVCLFPTDSIGIVVLTNEDGSDLPTNVRNMIADLMLELDKTDWHKDAGKEDKLPDVPKQVAVNSVPVHGKSQLVGSYSHEGYGTMNLTVVNDSIFVTTIRDKFWLKHFQYDIYEGFLTEKGKPVNTEYPSPYRFNFRTNDIGEISELTVPFEPSLDLPLVFKFAPNLPKETISEASLAKYVGKYDLSGMEAKVYTKGQSELYLFITGQPEYLLIPNGPFAFNIKGLNGFKLLFGADTKGVITDVQFIQPNGTFKAVKK